MKHIKTMSIISVMSIFFLVSGPLIINPALQNISEDFPEIPFTTVQMLATMPNLVATLFALIAGTVAGSKIKYKTLLVTAGLLFAIAGTAPYFMRDFNAIFISRVVFGIGVGLVIPLGNALVMRLYDGQKRANMMGLGSMIINAGGVFYTMLSGFITTINVNYTWIIHLSALIPMILVALFLPEPEKTEQVDGGKVKMPINVYLICTVFGLVIMLFFPMLLNMSTIVINEKLGNAVTAGTILSMNTVGGIIGGAIFGKTFKLVGRYIIPFALVLQVLGLGICFYANSVMILMAGTTITGIAIFLIFPAVLMDIVQMVPPAGVAPASGIMMGLMNLGVFASTFFMGFLVHITGDSSPRVPIFAGTMLTIVITVVWSYIKINNKPLVPQQPTA